MIGDGGGLFLGGEISGSRFKILLSTSVEHVAL